ncbi:RimJ/RimL family protein N-acetyltransferase [Nakamurella sp. UYEF19]|uniref:GNAT family N-acetyltransferase n=1 Tax=Nakamurella sp. UYEF19 TaxID=1756392 RepID=UPI0033918077
MTDDVPAQYEPMALSLESERLLLRPFESEDAAAYADLIAERGPGARGYGTTVDGARENIERLAKERNRTGIGFLAIHRRDESDLIGYAGLLVGRASLEEPEIAYELFSRVHGNGYATEAAAAIIEAAVETGRKRLWSTVAAWNHRSLRVLEKNGFREDHVETHEDSGDVVYLVRDL